MTALVVDQGLYVHVAERLAQDFGHVLYCNPSWREAFPKAARRYAGIGLENITSVLNPWPYVDTVDLIVFPDTYYGPEIQWLRDKGYRVWGSGPAEVIELYRKDLKDILEKLDMPTPKYQVVKGVSGLREVLLDAGECYVKASLFRGDCETFKNYKNCRLTESLIDHMAYELGPRKRDIEFVIEFPIDGPELGFDGSTIDGQFSNIVSWGYEAKDAGYIGQVCRYDDLPEGLRYVNAKLAPLFEELTCRSFYSNEIRKTPEGEYILMDPCMRAGSPPSEVYMQGFKNWAKHIYEGADGKVVDLEPEGKFFAEIIMSSSALVTDPYLAVDFPEEVRPYVKLRGHCIIDGQDYTMTMAENEEAFGAAVGVANTMEKAVAMAMDVADQIEGMGVSFDEHALESAIEKIKEGIEAGIEWFPQAGNVEIGVRKG